MSTSANDPEALVRAFEPVGLQVLNAKAEMLERLDNKYVVAAAVMARAIPKLLRHFDVLEIEGRRAFTYKTCYFDSDGLQSYFDHHQGRRQRAKVRMRSYTEAGLCFVEVKLKDKRGITVKKRLRYDDTKFGVLDGCAQDYVHSAYREQYHRDFPYDLRRVLDMQYRRTTLVAKQGGERMTIDSHLSFSANGTTGAISDGIFVVETKSANGNGIADRILRTLHQHPTRNCSKYCAGTAMMNAELKQNNFRSALRKLLGIRNSTGGVEQCEPSFAQ